LVKNTEKSALRALVLRVSPYAAPFCAALTIFLMFHYSKDNAIVMALDRLLTGRIKLGAYGLQNEGATFAGHFIPYLNGQVTWDPYWMINDFTFDNIYSDSLVHMGFIWLAVYTAVFYLLGRKRNFKISCYVIIWAVYGLTEVHGLNGFIWIPVLISAYLSKGVIISYIRPS